MNKQGGIILGFDVGTRRIGVARGDLDVRVSFPLEPIANDNSVFDIISNLLKDNNPVMIVVGLPRDSMGGETEQSKFSRDFGSSLEGLFGVKVFFQDESLTSVIAESNLRLRKDFKESMLRDGTLDSESAALILADFLEGGQNEVG